MAEKKFLEKDFQGANRMASKAHSLFPGLDGLSQFFEIIHIHIASSHKIHDAPDYYGILGVDSSADDDTLRRQYRRMALTLHLIRTIQAQMSSTSATAAEFFSSHSAAHYGNAPNTAQSRSTANQQRPDSFFEFMQLRKKVFRAMQVPAPNIKARGSRYWNLYRHAEDLSTFLNRWRSVPSSVPENCRDIPPRIVEPTTSPSSAFRNPLMEEPMKNLDGDSSTSTEGAGTKPGLCSLGKPESLIGADVQKGESVTFQAPSVKVNVNNPGPAKNKQPTKSDTKGLSHMEVKMERKELVRQFKKLDIEKNSLKKFHTEDPEKRSGGTFSDLNAKAIDVEACLDETLSMSVPDANFHNFDNERVENSFSNNQVWAAYGDDDGMPRYYALVHNLISRSPFELEICWLKSKSTTEFGSFEWISSGFTKTIGNFWGPRGVIYIFPAKGDVWAVYNNWSFEWNFDTEKDVIHKYEVVEVLRDYSDDHGVSVIALVKVAGFTTLFRRMPDHNVVWTIPKEEMFRFSHQVPVFKLDGMKDKGAPEGCYELDPAALPPELLEIITEAEATEATTQRVSEHRGHARRMDPKITEVFGKGN
ncbi:uncharacterized protein LOC127254084 [Andrographis paniculata]|uniref:uncharacterized protein LOC127254084 n=1 Tax=Andrographis paniculata TaxID=175694 RepID=UPI0021E957EA|nr:uncharacterized protein LOC127254084 [Andrographis paniculata]